MKSEVKSLELRRLTMNRTGSQRAAEGLWASFTAWVYIRGFNVSNLMGITRRITDIGKKMTFYFLQNV